MRLAQIVNGIVVNVAIGSEGQSIPDGWALATPGAGIGWTYDGEAFAAPVPAPTPVTAEQVRAERNRRLIADFAFNGVMFQRDPTSLQRITGAATLAGFAIAGGAQPGNLRWANPDRDFAWIASDDTPVTMDAHTAFAFGQAAAAVETRLVFAAKTLREMDPIPADFADDSYWV